MSRRILGLGSWVAPALVALALASPASAQSIRLRAPSTTLSLECTQAAMNWSFDSGAWYEQARNSLSNPGNFGPSGVVNVQFSFGPPFDTMDPKDLDGADILVLNPIKLPVDWIGLKVFGAYARGGVGFISFQNSALTFFADVGPCTGDALADITAIGAQTPIMQGPFGTVTSPIGTGFNCAFDLVTMDPNAVLLSVNDMGPNAASLDLAMTYPGAARAVSFGDEEIFADKTFNGCGAAKLSPGNNNDTLMRNVFAWVSQTAHDPIPDAQEIADGGGMMADTDMDGRPDVLDGDNDGDNILDLDEAGDTDPATPPIDTDMDGIPDYDDTDSDGDGIDDVVESGSILDPPPDTDMDGVPDVRDDDSDGDGVPDAVEGAVQSDGDGVPDFQDTDSDDDGVPDGTDTCRTVADATNADGDSDGVGDACDNCPADANPGQEDADMDGEGDACEPTGAGGSGGSGAGGGMNGSTTGSGTGGNGADSAPESSSGCGCRVLPARDYEDAYRLGALFALLGALLARARRPRR